PALSQAPGGREALLRVFQDRDARAAGALPDGAQRGAARQGQARLPEPRARQGDPRQGAPRVRSGRPALQPRLAQADPGNPVRPPEAAGEEEDPLGTTFDRRGLARRARARPPAAEADPRAPRAVEAEVDLH